MGGIRTITFGYGGASAQLRFFSPTEANLVNVHSANRRNGDGNELMRSVIAYADLHGITIYLRAQRYTRGLALDNAQLAEWYGRFGFVSTGRKDGIRMMRRISQGNPGS